MKKIVITIAILFGIVFGTSAQYFDNGNQRQGGGLFGYGDVSDEYFGGPGNTIGNPLLPSHFNNNNQDAPIGSGMLLLIGFGAAYAMSKKRNNK